jgi:hypothetical protein
MENGIEAETICLQQLIIDANIVDEHSFMKNE